MIRKLPVGVFSCWNALFFLSFIFISFLYSGCVEDTVDDGLFIEDNGSLPGFIAEDVSIPFDPLESADASNNEESPTDPYDNPVEGDDPPEDSPWTENEGDKEDATGCPGGFLCPCEESTDCLEGYCVPSPQGTVCTQACLDDCPEGWACEALLGEGPDIVFICMPSFPQQ